MASDAERLEFNSIDQELKVLAARCLTIGDALLYRTERVAMSNMDTRLVEQIAEYEDMAIIDEGAIAELANLESLIDKWHQAKRKLV